MPRFSTIRATSVGVRTENRSWGERYCVRCGVRMADSNRKNVSACADCREADPAGVAMMRRDDR
jgi:hypothetical protein